MGHYIHHLHGCAPQPLALYLKAIGILRLVAEQVDPDARGWWQDEHFCLLTKLDRNELEQFFLEEYSPTPLLAPWNGGSGFYRTWDARNGRLRNSKNAAALDQLIASDNPRLKSLREAYADALQVLPRYCTRVDVSALSTKERNKVLIMPVGDGPEFPVIPKNDAGKLQVQRVLLRKSRATAFYKSALVEVGEKVTGPWLWGSGGNDGNIDYTGRFFENVIQVLFPKEPHQNEALLKAALFGTETTGLLSQAAGKVGQFYPSSAGGANVTTGTGSQNDTSLNPWDFVLMLEGAINLSSRTTRRLDPISLNAASAPFAMRAHAAGFASPGSEKNDRGEQWLPLWSQPATHAEVRALFEEGRLQVNRKPVNRPVDAARAVARLGVARGITAFTRYGFLERNGQSTLAVPLGRIRVQHRPRATLVDDLAGWLNKLNYWARKRPNYEPPARLVHAERRLADAVFAVLTHDDTAPRWQAVLDAAVALEMLQKGETALRAGPIPKLQVGWIEAIHDNSPEIRLALALGSAAAGYSKDGRAFDPIRHHWLPLERGARRLQIKEKRLVNDPRVVMNGRDPVGDLAAVVARRLLEPESGSQRILPLKAARGCAASLPDLAELMDGHVDLSRVLTLGRALMALDWQQWYTQRGWERMPKRPPADEQPDEAWLALRLACLPWPIDEGISVAAESSMVSRLSSGDAAPAVRIARQRLGASGVRVPFLSASADSSTARLWAAALAFPISRYSARCAVQIVVPDFIGVAHEYSQST